MKIRKFGYNLLKAEETNGTWKKKPTTKNKTEKSIRIKLEKAEEKRNMTN